MPARVLVMARDAGAAAALSPVARALIREGRLGVSIVASGQAAGVFRERGLPVLSYSESPTQEQIESLLARECARVVLTGTSMQAAKDAAFWDAARRVGIPSIALVDHWCNYSERFTSEAPFDSVPDTIAVMDDAAAAALEAEGCPTGLLLVTGQPHFDELIRDSVTLSRTEVRQELDVDPGRPLLVFASEPQAHYFGDTLGYTENDALRALLDSAVEVSPDAQVVVKLHPLEPPDGFSDLPEAESRIAVRVIRAYPPEHLIRAADVVVGMTSVFLLEAVLTGVPAISVRPGGQQTHFLSVHDDKIVSVTDPLDLPSVLRHALADDVREVRKGGTFGERAIERTVGAVYERARIPEAAATMTPLEQPFIRSERCYLRPLTRADLDGNWTSWLNDPEVTRHMFRGMFPETEESNKEFYEEVRSSPNDLVLAIVAADADVHVGNVGLHRIDWVNRSAEFGILVGERDYWNRGIGTEATEAVVRHGFDKLNLHRIWLGVFADHGGAIKVYERIGFRKEGTLREAILRDGRAYDQLIMGLLAHEFRSAQSR